MSPPKATLDGMPSATATVRLNTTARMLMPPPILPERAPSVHSPLVSVAGLVWLAAWWMPYNLRHSARLRRGFAAVAGFLPISIGLYSFADYSGTRPGPLILSWLAFKSIIVKGGFSSTRMVTLSGSASPGGIHVYLPSNSSAPSALRRAAPSVGVIAP
jgi:hypothetical protein